MLSNFYTTISDVYVSHELCFLILFYFFIFFLFFGELHFKARDFYFSANWHDKVIISNQLSLISAFLFVVFMRTWKKHFQINISKLEKGKSTEEYPFIGNNIESQNSVRKNKKRALRTVKGHCSHILVGAPSCNLDMVYNLQEWICRTAVPSLAASLEPFGSLPA